jgi:uncharacterized protein (UPF0297 family)
MRRMPRLGILLFFCLAPFIFLSAIYWDAKPTGGIVPKGTPDIVIHRAQLVISPGKISAVYELANETARDIVSEIVFPVPEYGYNFMTPIGDILDFKVWADGKAIPYETEAHAFVDGVERTNILNELGITIETFGFFDEYDYESSTKYFHNYEINLLTREQRKKLVDFKIIADDDNSGPRWSVLKFYKWTQRFPARRAVRIRHEYAPIYGSTQIPIEELRQELRDACLSDELLNKMKEAESQTGGKSWTYYVGSIRYLLTTVNAWKGPIRDFEMIIDRSPLPRSWPAPRYMGFCWEGVVPTPDNRSYVIQKKDFSPTKDLTVYYFW